jgi:hypothetical protein
VPDEDVIAIARMIQHCLNSWKAASRTGEGSAESSVRAGPQRWAYRTELISAYDSEGRSDAAQLDLRLGELGSEGWELCSLVLQRFWERGDGHSNVYRAVLKRPRG